MSVVTAITDDGPCRKRLEIEVPPEAVQAETQRVVRGLRSRAKIPGFRKGKVPLELVKTRFESEIRQQVIDQLVPRYWRQAETESQIDPLMPPQVETVDLENGETLSFVATVETRPEIELGKLHDYDLPEAGTEVSEEEVDRALEDVRRNRADLVPVERPAAAGDVVVVHLTELGGDGEEAKATETVTVEVGSANVWKELSDALEGRSADDQTEFARPLGEEADAGERRFRAHLAVVKERDLPELTDEWATELGEFDDLAALRGNIENQLGNAKREELQHQREEAAVEQLCQRHPLQLPEGVVQQEIEHMLRDYAGNLAQRGIDVETAAVDWQGLAEQIRPQARKRVHSRLILDAIVAAEDLQVPEDEFEMTLAGIARMEGRPTAAVRRDLDSAGRLGELRGQLARRRALKFVLGDDLTEATETEDGEGEDAAPETPGESG